ncbi:MAG: CBS domain-containing protein [Candidatus Thermoplasmatota archaeon]|nr:CBS domain-containing protein [Candidatus Thermoplasmatota archaeon]MBU1940987.1 CBS domain-containing protein [Candidatus Thermoplasmatota archaeon]
MVTAEEIVNRKMITLEGNEIIAKTLRLFKETDAIIVTDKNNYQGMLLKRSLMEPKLSLQTKIHTLITHVPKISPTASLEEIARLMIENDVYHLPVISDEKPLGIVNAADIIENLMTHPVEIQPVKTFMNSKPLTINPEETLGKAITLLHQHNHPALAVVDHTDFVGMITLNEIVEKVIHPEAKIKGQAGHGDFSHYKKKIFSLTIKAIMQEEPRLTIPDTPLHEVIYFMQTSNQTNIFVGQQNHLQGLVSYKEILTHMVPPVASKTFEILFHRNTKAIEGFDKTHITQLLEEEFLQHYLHFLKTGNLHISLEQHKETKMKQHRIVCEMKLSTFRGIFYASHEGWGSENAIRNTYKAIEHQLSKAKEEDTETKHRR